MENFFHKITQAWAVYGSMKHSLQETPFSIHDGDTIRLPLEINTKLHSFASGLPVHRAPFDLCMAQFTHISCMQMSSAVPILSNQTSSGLEYPTNLLFVGAYVLSISIPSCNEK